MIFGKIKTFIKDPATALKNYAVERRQKEVAYCMEPENYEKISDKRALKAKFYYLFSKKLDLRHPKTFNEKIQWLKLYDRRPEYVRMVDKYEVKRYIAEKVGEEYVVPTLGVWDRVEDIDFDALPDQFVLKCTHDSASVKICKDKSDFDFEEAKQSLSEHLGQSMFIHGREWVYKKIKPSIIAEPYLVDESGVELKDYKIFCFNGRADYVEVDFNRFVKHKLNTYDFDWKPLGFCDASKNDYDANIPKPSRLEDMRRIAEELSKDIPFLRVDFYSIYDRIYIGELTFYPGSGFIFFDPLEMNLELGKKLTLPKKKRRANS